MMRRLHVVLWQAFGSAGALVVAMVGLLVGILAERAARAHWPAHPSLAWIGLLVPALVTGFAAAAWCEPPRGDPADDRPPAQPPPSTLRRAVQGRPQFLHPLPNDIGIRAGRLVDGAWTELPCGCDRCQEVWICRELTEAANARGVPFWGMPMGRA